MSGAVLAPPAGGAPVAAPSLPKPLRIKTLTVCDFRAFAGPEPVPINFDGKNMLIYGENGAGKSSIFHALNEVFSVSEKSPQARKKKLEALENIFPNPGKGNVSVEVVFDGDTKPARWDVNRHPADISLAKADARIVNGAYRKAALDYRALLDTNYRHGVGKVNLFDVCINVLLRDYPAPHDGKEERLFDLWRRLDGYLSRKKIRNQEKDEINSLSQSFNQGLRNALDQLRPQVDALLIDLGWDDIKLTGLTTPGVTYNLAGLKRLRAFSGCEVTPELTFRGVSIPVPQTFLNEARLSALALAIYFSGRKICAATLQTDTPRLMVLDDVLIGLDQSNRLPVLQMLDKHFSDWQIALLTHDRVWFEMARFHLAEREDWQTLELFEEIEPTGASRPILRHQKVDAVVSNIATAKKFHAAHEYSAAAVHARVAFELSLKRLCEKNAYLFGFSLTPVSFRQMIY